MQLKQGLVCGHGTGDGQIMTSQIVLFGYCALVPVPCAYVPWRISEFLSGSCLNIVNTGYKCFEEHWFKSYLRLRFTIKFTAVTRDFSLLQNVQTRSTAHSVPYVKRMVSSSAGIKRPSRDH
jgi:hypothetical protein